VSAIDYVTTPLLIAAGLTLIPFVLLGFKVLARSSAILLSGLFLAGCFGLLVPVREGIYSALVLLPLVAGSLVSLVRASRQDLSLKTIEGRIAKWLVILPLSIMLARNFMHSADSMYLCIVAAAAWGLLRQTTLSIPPQRVTRKALEAFSIVPSIILSIATTALIESYLTLSFTACSLIFGSLMTVLLTDLSQRAASGHQLYSIFSIVFLILTTLIAWLTSESLLIAGFACLSGTALCAYGTWQQRQAPLIGGSLLILSGFTLILAQQIDRFELNHWFLMTIAGMLAIVAASYLEKRGEHVKAFIQIRKQRLSKWSY